MSHMHATSTNRREQLRNREAQRLLRRKLHPVPIREPPTVHARNRRLPTVVSRLRSREFTINNEPFSHPLLRQPNGAEVLIDFDGKDDPYRPMNWPFEKKVITTVLFANLFQCTTTCFGVNATDDHNCEEVEDAMNVESARSQA